MTNPKIIYHYTNIEALVNGIISNNEICLWATHCAYLNDPFDHYLGDEILQNHNPINKLWNSDLYPTIKRYAASYIISFSESIDSLPMWNMYGKNGSGVKLGFDVKKINEVCDLYQCFYQNTDNHQQLLGVIDDKINHLLANMPDRYKNDERDMLVYLYGHLHEGLRLIKSEFYEHEREWRVVFHMQNNKELHFRHSSGLIVPYLKKIFPKEALKEVWIGPTSDMDRVRESLHYYLAHKSFYGVDIRKSDVPYRK